MQKPALFFTMGLFWKSDSDRIIEQIQAKVSYINHHLLKLQNSLIANNGASDANIDELNYICERLLQQQNDLNNLLQRLPPSKQNSIGVPWVDGSYSSLFAWMMTYNVAVAKLQHALKKYYGNTF